MKQEKHIQSFAERLGERFPGEVKPGEPLKHYTTYKVGGPVSAFCTPESKENLQAMIRLCRENEVPYYILGGGSNILVHDRGMNMIVIRLCKCCSQINRDGTRVYAGAGASVAALVEYCEAHHLAGLDYMAGIPGTVGGALRMNAGAFGGEIGDRVILVEALDRDGNPVNIPGPEAGFGYRRANNLQDKILLGSYLQMMKGSKARLESTREDYLARRSSKQPLDYGSCGSVFKRPPGNFAGTLIEKAGCKGLTHGGAMVSPKHANFILNYRNASARDIYELIRTVQREVYRKFHIWLELEVKLVGFSAEQIEKVRGPHE